MQENYRKNGHMKSVWILGTSKDINSLNSSWFLGKDVIGINTSGFLVEGVGGHLNHWVSYDCLHAHFLEWVLSTKMDSCRKWIFRPYSEGHPVVGSFLPEHPEFENVKHRNVRFFDVNKPFILDPFVVDEPTGTRLDSHEFTLFTAISLAVGLGYDEIRLRGVEFQGSHWNDTQNSPKIDMIYCQQVSYFKRYMLPLLKSRRVMILNDTPNAAAYFRDWELVER
jgi:hypothetical protein